MPREELRKTLDELHEELATSGNLDAETRDRLRQTVLDIQARLARKPGDAHDEEEESPATFLEEWVRDFETAHPKLAYTIGRVIDLLAQSGI